MPLNKYRIFKNLEGNWDFIRKIDNKLTTSLSGVVTGTASFAPILSDPNILHYVENGELITASGHKNSATQEYFYKVTDAGDIEVYFGSGGEMLEFFHVINDGVIADHICRDDCYKIQYEFGDDQFSIVYDVIGPNKNYISSTKFKRK